MKSVPSISQGQKIAYMVLRAPDKYVCKWNFMLTFSVGLWGIPDDISIIGVLHSNGERQHRSWQLPLQDSGEHRGAVQAMLLARFYGHIFPWGWRLQRRLRELHLQKVTRSRISVRSIHFLDIPTHISLLSVRLAKNIWERCLLYKDRYMSAKILIALITRGYFSYCCEYIFHANN